MVILCTGPIYHQIAMSHLWLGSNWVDCWKWLSRNSYFIWHNPISLFFFQPTKPKFNTEVCQQSDHHFLWIIKFISKKQIQPVLADYCIIDTISNIPMTQAAHILQKCLHALHSVGLFWNKIEKHHKLIADNFCRCSPLQQIFSH